MRGILLCGGKSSRMGKKKQWLLFEKKPLLLHAAEWLASVCTEVVVVANDEEDVTRCRALGLSVVSDVFPGQGPLAGLQAGLAGLGPEEAACLVGCDLPFLRAEVLRDLQAELAAHPECQAVVPCEEGGRFFAVSAVYRGDVRDAATACLEKGDNALRHFLATLKVRDVPVDRWKALTPPPFFNMNTPDDYRTACTLWKEGNL